MRNKFMILVLIIVVITTLCSACVMGEEINENDICIYEDYEYVILDDNTIAFVGFIGRPTKNTDLKIPSTIDGKTVTTLKRDVINSISSTCKSITIPDTITDIQGKFFYAFPTNLIIVSPENKNFKVVNNALYKVLPVSRTIEFTTLVHTRKIQ